MVAKGRQARGEKNGQSKLTIKDVEEMREIYKVKKISCRELGWLYRVSPSTVSGIIKGDYWKLPLAE